MNIDIYPHNNWPWVLIFVLTIIDHDICPHNINHDILFLLSSQSCVPQISDLKYQIQCGEGSTWILRKLPRLSLWKIWSCKTWSILPCNSMGKLLSWASPLKYLCHISEHLCPCLTNVYWLWFCNGPCVSHQALLGGIQKLRWGPWIPPSCNLF